MQVSKLTIALPKSKLGKQLYSLPPIMAITHAAITSLSFANAAAGTSLILEID